MAVIVSDNGGNFERVPTGMQHAVCANVFDLGIIPGYQGVMQHKGVMLFELEARRTEGEFAGKRFLVSKSYTMSLNEKANLRKDLASWRGRDFTEDELKGFDLEKVVGVNCNLNLIPVEKNGKTYANIASINPVMNGQERLVPEVEPYYTPEWIKTMLHKEELPTAVSKPSADFEDDIPF